MYMHEGKPIEVPYGRRNVNVTKLEFQALLERVEALEAIVNEDKPKRGRPPKEVQE